MKSERLLLISDVHVDAWPADLPNAHQQKRKKLLDFFDWVVDGSGAGRLVINGDLIDVPQQDRGPILPRYMEVAAKLQKVVAAGIKFGYVIGNHDSGLVGLDIALNNPPVQVEYPYLVVKSGGRNIVVEHGHLQDPWLWDYVRTLASQMLAKRPGPSSPVFLRATAAAAAAPAAPGPAEASLQLHRLWQTRGEKLDPRSPEAAALVAAVQKDLQEDYRDVTDSRADRAMIGKRARLRGRLGTAGPRTRGATALTVAPKALTSRTIEQAVQALYSGPHWRKVAKERAATVSKESGQQVTGVVMGHTHWPDELKWTENGREYHYINAGSWRHESADIVVIEKGVMRLYQRKWDEDWPKLC